MSNAKITYMKNSKKRITLTLWSKNCGHLAQVIIFSSGIAGVTNGAATNPKPNMEIPNKTHENTNWLVLTPKIGKSGSIAIGP